MSVFSKPTLDPGVPQWAIVKDASWQPLSQTIHHTSGKATGTSLYVSEREKVLKEAHDEGVKLAQKEINVLKERYAQSINDLTNLRDQILHKSEKDLVELALVIAKELVLSDMDAHKVFVEKMTKHALQTLQEADKITIKSHPDDFKQVKDLLAQSAEENEHVRVLSDAAIKLGGVVADSVIGMVDATLERRLEEMRKQLFLSHEVVAKNTKNNHGEG